MVKGGRCKNSNKSGTIREQNPEGPEEETGWRGKEEKEVKTQGRGHGEVRREEGERGTGETARAESTPQEKIHPLPHETIGQSGSVWRV